MVQKSYGRLAVARCTNVHNQQRALQGAWVVHHSETALMSVETGHKVASVRAHLRLGRKQGCSPLVLSL